MTFFPHVYDYGFLIQVLFKSQTEDKISFEIFLFFFRFFYLDKQKN